MYSPKPYILLLIWIGFTARIPATWGQDTGGNTTTTKAATTPENKASDNRALNTESVAYRPLNTLEQFAYESEIANQLQNQVSRYMDANLFHISVQIEGRIPLNAGLTKDRAAKGLTDPNTPESEEILTMLPALPIFNSRRRTAVTVERGQNAKDRPGSDNISPEMMGPQIDQIQVVMLVDSAITNNTIDFFKGFISSLLRLNTARGDVITVKQTSFPKNTENGNSALDSPGLSGQRSPEPSREEAKNMQALRQNLEKLSSTLPLTLGLGLGLLGLFVFLGLLMHGRLKAKETGSAAASAGTQNTNRTAGPERAPTSNEPNQARENNGNLGAGVLNLQPQDPSALPVYNDPLMEWLINQRQRLALALEEMLREQGESGYPKIIQMLYPYGEDYFVLLQRHLELGTANHLQTLWKEWTAERNNPRDREMALKDLQMAMNKQAKMGFFPFINYLSDEEIYQLLLPETPLHCLMVLEGLGAERKARILSALGAEQTTKILTQYPLLEDLKFKNFADLSASLFAGMNRMREAAGPQVKAYAMVLENVRNANLSNQEKMLVQLLETDAKMHEYIREKVVLWGDVLSYPNEALNEAIASLGSNEFVDLVGDDAEVTERLLALRPPREQLLLKEVLSQGPKPSSQTEPLRRELLGRLLAYKESGRLAQNTTESNPVLTNQEPLNNP